MSVALYMTRACHGQVFHVWGKSARVPCVHMGATKSSTGAAHVVAGVGKIDACVCYRTSSLAPRWSQFPE